MNSLCVTLELTDMSNLNDRMAYIDTFAFADLIGILNESAIQIDALGVYDYTIIKLLEIYRCHIENGLFQSTMTLYSNVAELIICKAILWEQTKINNFLEQL